MRIKTKQKTNLHNVKMNICNNASLKCSKNRLNFHFTKQFAPTPNFFFKEKPRHVLDKL